MVNNIYKKPCRLSLFIQILVVCFYAEGIILGNFFSNLYPFNASYNYAFHVQNIFNISYFDKIARQKYTQDHNLLPVAMIMVPSVIDDQAGCLISQAYQCIHKHNIDTVILIAQSQQTHFYGVAVPTVSVMSKLCKNCTQDIIQMIQNLVHHQHFYYDDKIFYDSDFIQQHVSYIGHYTDKEVKLIPMVLGHVTSVHINHIAESLAQMVDDNTVIIMQSHIHDEFKTIYHEYLFEEDQSLIQSIQAIPTGKFYGKSLSQHYMWMLLLALLRQPIYADIQSSLLGYHQSIQHNHIISYASFVYHHRAPYQGYINIMNSYEQEQLISHAYDALHRLFDPHFITQRYMVSYEMMQARGAFVTLYAMTDHGTLLRGCMGCLESDIPLFDLITDITQQAAQEDHRFYPLKYQEIKSTMVDIAVINHFQHMSDLSLIQQTDGILFEFQGKSAISLPSPSPLELWSYQSILTEICMQMHIPIESWQRQEAKIFTFDAFHFQ